MSELPGTIACMELARALDDLDARPWSVISHAYGSAEDLPDVLRALAGTDPSAADEAVTELYGSVLHQGTVYAASAEVVPFLARIAASGHRTADVLELLGGMAQSEDEHGVTPGTVRAAVAEQLPCCCPCSTLWNRASAGGPPGPWPTPAPSIPSFPHSEHAGTGSPPLRCARSS